MGRVVFEHEGEERSVVRFPYTPEGGRALREAERVTRQLAREVRRRTRRTSTRRAASRRR